MYLHILSDPKAFFSTYIKSVFLIIKNHQTTEDYIFRPTVNLINFHFEIGESNDFFFYIVS